VVTINQMPGNGSTAIRELYISELDVGWMRSLLCLWLWTAVTGWALQLRHCYINLSSLVHSLYLHKSAIIFWNCLIISVFANTFMSIHLVCHLQDRCSLHMTKRVDTLVLFSDCIRFVASVSLRLLAREHLLAPVYGAEDESIATAPVLR